MRYWNIINSCRSITASCSSRINLASASKLSSEIRISIEQNRMGADLDTLDSLLLEPNSVNASLSKSIASSAESWVSNMADGTSDRSRCESSSALDSAGNGSQKKASGDHLAHSNGSFKAGESSGSASESIHNSNYSRLSNHMDSWIAKHNRSVVNAANARRNHLASRSGEVSGASSQALNKTVNQSSRSQPDGLNINAIYASELRKLDHTELRSNRINTSGKNHAAESNFKVNHASDSNDTDHDSARDSKVNSLSSSIAGIFNAVAGSASNDQRNVLHFGNNSQAAPFRESDPLNSHLDSAVGLSAANSSDRETLDFGKIKSKSASNGTVHAKDRINQHEDFNHRRELHGLEHHVKHLQNSSTVDRYMKNFALSIMTVIVTVFLIGVVSYASTLF